jgi:hypothetical protein
MNSWKAILWTNPWEFIDCVSYVPYDAAILKAAGPGHDLVIHD